MDFTMAKPRPKRPPGYKNTITRFRELFADGKRHTLEELAALLWDTDGGTRNVSPHLAKLRVELAKEGLTIVSIRNGGTYYQMEPISQPASPAN